MAIFCPGKNKYRTSKAKIQNPNLKNGLNSKDYLILKLVFILLIKKGHSIWNSPFIGPKEMKKAFYQNPKRSHPRFFIFMTIIFFTFGCAGVQPKEKPAQPSEPKIEETKKEELSDHPAPQPPPPKPVPPPPPEPPKVEPQPPSPPPSAPPSPVYRMTQILWSSVNLREGPGINYKVIGNVKKGTSLAILEEKGNWFHVRLENGSEAWVSKLATSEAPKSSPSSTPSKPKPM